MGRGDKLHVLRRQSQWISAARRSRMHRRQVLKIAGDLWLVRDIAVGRAEHELEIRWHFAPDLEVQAELGLVEISRVSAASSDPRLNLIVPTDTVWQTSTEVSRTLLSPAYGALRPAPLVRCHARVALPAETATALVPRSGATRLESPAFAPRFASMTLAGVQVYELDYPTKVTDSFLYSATRRGVSALGPRMLERCIVASKMRNLPIWS